MGKRKESQWELVGKLGQDYILKDKVTKKLAKTASQKKATAMVGEF